MRPVAACSCVYFRAADSPSLTLSPADAQLANTGLERGAALEKDIAYMQQHWGLQAPVAAEDGIGHRYAKWVGMGGWEGGCVEMRVAERWCGGSRGRHRPPLRQVGAWGTEVVGC